MREVEPSDTFEVYDDGFRLGTFDKCNGRPERFERGLEDEIFFGGYFDGYDGNSVQIAGDEPEPTEPETFMFRLWAEWDMGQDELIFSSEDALISWADRAIGQDADLEYANFEEARNDGLASIQPLKVID